jgi:hypothetical protein
VANDAATIINAIDVIALFVPGLITETKTTATFSSLSPLGERPRGRRLLTGNKRALRWIEPFVFASWQRHKEKKQQSMHR